MELEKQIEHCEHTRNATGLTVIVPAYNEAESITDTVNSNNIYFTIRTGTSYPFQNIWLFVTTTSPAGKSITDTLQYILADEKGKWYGKGFGNIHELNLPFRTSVYFPKEGTFSFKIRHGMRTENLKGVYDIGLRIERVKN